MNNGKANRIQNIVVALCVIVLSIAGTRTATAHGSDRLLHKQGIALGDNSLTVWT